MHKDCAHNCERQFEVVWARSGEAGYRMLAGKLIFEKLLRGTIFPIRYLDLGLLQAKDGLGINGYVCEDSRKSREVIDIARKKEAL